MIAGSAFVALLATTGWLFLNWRALQAHDLSGRQKLLMAAAWVAIFALAAVLAGELA